MEQSNEVSRSSEMSQLQKQIDELTIKLNGALKDIEMLKNQLIEKKKPTNENSRWCLVAGYDCNGSHIPGVGISSDDEE